MGQIPVQNGQLPAGFCPPDLQTMLNGFSAVQFVNINTISSISVSSTPPADHTVAWLQLDTPLGRPVRLYFFSQGAWLSQHPLVPGFTMLWPLALPENPNATFGFPTFDGGDANAISALSGPMWQLVCNRLDGVGPTQLLQAQFPVGVGTFPHEGSVAVQASVTSTGQLGEDNHVLVIGETPSHQHFVANTDSATPGFPNIGFNTSITQLSGSSGSQSTDYTLKGSGTAPTLGLTSVVGTNGGHNCLPPFCGVYYFQRTARLFYVIHP